MPRHLEFHVSCSYKKKTVQLHALNVGRGKSHRNNYTLHYVRTTAYVIASMTQNFGYGYKCFVYPIFKYKF